MSTCKIKCVGYCFEFDDSVNHHVIFVPRVDYQKAKDFIDNVKTLVATGDVNEKVLLKETYVVNINYYQFHGIGDITVSLSNDPGEVLVTGSYESIIQLGPSSYGGSGRIISPCVRVKIDDLLGCYQGLV